MRRPLALLLVLVLLLQSGLVGSGAACLAGVLGAEAGATGAAAAPPEGGAHHHAHHAASGRQAGEERGAAPTPHELAHCLAAACATPALVATLAVLPVPASVSQAEAGAEPTAPYLARLAPEPPPPRG